MLDDLTSLRYPAHISTLNGQAIVRWVATEMALSDGDPQDTPLVWAHPSVPYLQLISIDVQLADGSVFRMLSNVDDGSGFHGLYLVCQDAIDKPSVPKGGSTFFRTRELNELPIGTATVAVTEIDGPHAVLRAEIVVHARTISCWAAEVYERDGGHFDLVAPDESILVQVDGVRPRLKIEGRG